MERDILYNNISKYIFGQDHLDPNGYDFNNFSITDFDYRKLFEGNNFITNDELSLKFFGTTDEDDLSTIYKRFDLYTTVNPDKWKVAFIFFMTLPLTEFEFVGTKDEITDPDNLGEVTNSHATDNILIGTFSNIEFIDCREIPQKRFEENLKTILDTDIFSQDLFTTKQRKKVTRLLLKLRFVNEHEYIIDIKNQNELTFRDVFKKFLFDPICNFVAALQQIKIFISERNNSGPTGVETKVPHQTNDIFHSYPDICAFMINKVRNTLVVVEVKKLPLFIHHDKIDFNDPLTNSFFLQLLSEMFSNRKNKGILTDSNYMVLAEIDHKRTKALRDEKAKIPPKRKRGRPSKALRKKRKIDNSNIITTTKYQDSEPKIISLNYKVVNLHSSGVTIMGALTSFIYEAFEGNDYKEEANQLYKIYQYIRKTDDEYLEYLTNEYQKVLPETSSKCREKSDFVFREEKFILLEFDKIDIQSGFNYNSQIFKVEYSDVEEYFISYPDLDHSDEIVVKVFDTYKFKRIHKTTELAKSNRITNCINAYSSERTAYEILTQDKRFNSLYLDHKEVFGEFYIGKYYHAMGPFIILRYLKSDVDIFKASEDERLAIYKLAKFQLRLIHSKNILHSDILQGNVLYSSKENKVYLIDFGFSQYDGNEKESRPCSANPESIMREHIQLCKIFDVDKPTKEEWRDLIMHYVGDDEVC